MKNKMSKFITSCLLMVVAFVQFAATTGAGAASWFDAYQPKTPTKLNK